MGSLTYNSNNQKSGTGYSYDGNGNPTTYAGTSLGFDLESRLTAIGSSWSAGYRPDGLRGSKSVNSTTTYFLYDGATPVAELNSSGTITALNVFGADGLIGRVVPGGTDIQYLFDHQGNVAQRLDGSGSVVSKSTYDAYGAESNTGTPSDPFGYNAQSGYYLDRETGLYLCTFRYYDPAKGRWLNRDPIGYAGGMNLYGYCGAGPVGEIDSLGLLPGDGWLVWPMIGFGPLLGGQTNSDGLGGTSFVGGILANPPLNPSGNVMTIDGVQLMSPDTQRSFLSQSDWILHEHWHSDQQECLGMAYYPIYAAGWAVGAVDELLSGRPSQKGPIGHDTNPLELDADNHDGASLYVNPLSPIERIGRHIADLARRLLGPLSSAQ